jgi:fibronectin-binding autotransporter adhesin
MAATILALSAMWLSRSVQAASNTPDNVVNGQSDLAVSGTYSAGLPTTTNDVVFTAQSYSPATFTDSSNTALTMGSLNDLASNAVTIQNSNSADTNAQIQLTGGDATASSNSADVIYVSSGSSLTIGGGSGSLTLNDQGSANRWDVGGTLTISSNTTVNIVNSAGLAFYGSGNVTVDGNITSTGTPATLSFNGSGTITLAGVSSAPVTAVLAQGTLNLSNQNALQTNVLNDTGGTVVFDQSVSGNAFNIGGLSGSVNIALQNNASTAAPIALSLGNTRGASSSYLGNFSGNGSLIKIGINSQTLGGTDTETGTTTVAAGTLEFAKEASFYNDQAGALVGYWNASNIVVENGGTLAVEVGNVGGFTANDINILSGLGTNGGGFEGGSSLGIDTGISSFTYPNVISGANVLGLAKISSGTLTLTAANLYAGVTTIVAGTLQLGTGSSGLDGSIANSPVVLNSGTLAYDNVTNQTCGGIIAGTGALTKSGTGTLTLTNANTFTGSTTISSGQLTLSNSNALQNSALTNSSGPGAVVFDQSVTSNSFTIGGLKTGNNLALVNNATVPAAIALFLNPSGSDMYNNVLSGPGSSITISGAGTQVLDGPSTYTGSTTINLGTLKLDFGQASSPLTNILYNGIAPASLTSAQTLNMGYASDVVSPTMLATSSAGDGTLSIAGRNSTNNIQSFYGLTLNPGSSSILTTPGAGTAGVELNIGAITHNTGGSVDFIPGGTYAHGTNAINTTTTNDATGIIGGYAFYNKTNYASVNGSGDIVAYGGYTTVASGGAILDSGTAANETNVQLTGASGTETLSGTSNGATNINTLDQNESGAAALTLAAGTLRLGVNGGILDGSTQGLTLNGGTLTAGGNNYDTAGEITIAQLVNAGIAIGSVIANNNASTGAANSSGDGAVSVTLDGAGVPGGTTSVTLTAANTYSGGTILEGARVEAANAAAFGTGTVTVLPGGQAYLDGYTYANNFSIAGIGAGEGGAYNAAVRFSAAAGIISGNVNLLGDAAVVTQSGGTNAGAITGNLTGSGGISLVTANGGTTPSVLTIGSAGSVDTITGNFCLDGFTPGVPTNSANAFTVMLGGNNALPSTSQSAASVGNVIINGQSSGTYNTTLDVAGFSPTINGLVSVGPYVATAFVTNSGANATLTLGYNNATAIYQGTITDAGAGHTLAIIKQGTGVQTFTGSNNYLGGTTINGGTLLADSSDTTNGSTGSGLVTVNSGGTLAGSGVVKGGITVNSGGTLTAGAGGASGAPGLLNANYGTTTLANGSNFNVKVNNVTGAAGTNWDEVLMSLLSVSSTVNINLYGLTAADVAGATPGFNNTTSFTLQIATLSGVSQSTLSGELADFSLNTSNFTISNPISSGGTFTLLALADGPGSYLDLQYNATPEPGAAMLVLAATVPMLNTRRRRRAPVTQK